VRSPRRAVSPKLARRVSSGLNLDPAAASRLEQAFSGKRAKLSAHERAAIQLSTDQFQMVAEWFHFAILSLAETEGFRGEADWIAHRLGIPASRAELALERLLRLGMLARDDRGYRSTGRAFTTSDGIPQESIRQSHLQDLELARASLEQDPLDARYFTSMTMTIDPARLPEAARELRRFRDRFCTRFETPPRRETYKLTLGFFPLSKPISRPTHE
jgi:uncharacterized protein (TIGR02147 family)